MAMLMNNNDNLPRLRNFANMLAVIAAAAAPAAWAQGQPPIGTITFAAALASTVQPVPTLAQWGVVTLSLLMALLAWRTARSRLACLAVAAGPVVLAAALLVSASWSGQAEAQPVPGAADVALDNPAGGTADIPYMTWLDSPGTDYMYQYEVRNTTAKALRIAGITLTPGHNERSPSDSPRCTVGSMLAANEGCYLLVSKPH